MTQVIRETIEIDALPDRVWELAGDPARIGEWVPALAGASLSGGERVCTTQDGGEIRERIVDRSEGERSYEYEIVESPVPLRSYRSRIAVAGHDGHSHVDWEAVLEAEDYQREAELAEAFASIYRDGLAELRRRLEASG